MDIIITNSSDEPIYAQITSQIKAQIMSGELREGDALPSMRTLAQQLTTKRAYEDLERDGYIESYTGRGSFIKGQNKEFLREENLRKIEKSLMDAVETAKVSDVSVEELKEMLDLFYEG